MASQSILTSVKKNCGVTEDYEVFDPDFLLYINGVFSTLTQLGIGPDDGFTIEDKSTTWDAYLGSEKRLESVKTYVSLKVRLLFDPPTQSYVKDAIEKQIEELAWRINVFRESQNHPILVVPTDPDLDGGEIDTNPTTGWIFDGGGP